MDEKKIMGESCYSAADCRCGEKRQNEAVHLVYLVCLVCLVEPDGPDQRDEPDDQIDQMDQALRSAQA